MANVVKIEAARVAEMHRSDKQALKKRVAAYCRVSTAYEEQLNSYESQMKYYENYIRSQEGWELAGIYADQAITGTKVDRREGFQKMIIDADDGKIDLIICKSISRFARNTVDTLQYVRMLKDKGVEVYFEEENIKTMTMDGELLLTILSSVAQQEVENISEHVKAGIHHKMADGIPVGFNECLGYRYDSEKQTLVIIEDEAEIVRLIFRLYLEGKGPTLIRKELEEKGYKTKKGKSEWQEATINLILRNEKYKGDLLMGKTVTVDPINKKRVRNYGQADKYLVHNHHEPIIPPELFDRVQETIKKRSSDFRRDSYGTRTRYSNKYPFSNKIRCGFCSGTLTRRSIHGGSSKYHRVVWQCSPSFRRGKEKCVNSKAVHEEMIEKAFVACFNHMIENKSGIIIEVLDAVDKALDVGKANQMLDDNQARQQKLRKKNSQLIDLLMEKKISDEEYSQKHDENVSKLNYLLEEETNLKESSRIKQVSQERIAAFRKTLEKHEVLEEFDQEVFELVVDRVIVGGYIDEVPDPFMITFCFKAGIATEINGKPFKTDGRVKNALSSDQTSDIEILYSTAGAEAPALPLLPGF